MKNDNVEYNEGLPVDLGHRQNPEIERLNAASDLMNSTDCMLQSAENAMNSIKSVVDSVGSSIVAWKEIDKEMLSMTLHFERFAKELDTDLSKYKARIPLVEKQLDAINANLTKMLDFVLAMEPKSEQEMDFKMKMMDRIDSFMNMLSSTMMNLL